MRFWLLVIAITSMNCSTCTNGHVDPKPFVAVPGDDVVHCICNLNFTQSSCGGDCKAHFDIELCMPTYLQRPKGTDDMGEIPDGGDEYSREINTYCQEQVTNDVYHLIKVFSGDWCKYKSKFAPDGGVGQSVSCFAQERHDNQLVATTTDDGTCRMQCPDVVCSEQNCVDGVEDQYGNVNLDNCHCSQVLDWFACPGDDPGTFPTEVFCRPPKGTVQN